MKTVHIRKKIELVSIKHYYKNIFTHVPPINTCERILVEESKMVSVYISHEGFNI